MTAGSENHRDEGGALRLRKAGIDPERLARHHLGWPRHLLQWGYAPWVWTALVGFALWLAIVPLEALGYELPPFTRSVVSLVVGLVILKSACEALIAAVERLSARRMWDHYIAGTLGEIVATLPELVVICFVIPVSPLAAMVIALVTIYNNAFVFSVYSYFLPKNKKGQYLMPPAITEAGTRLLIAGAGLGSVIGLVMLTFALGDHSKQAFAPIDMAVLAVIMFGVFGVYLRKLIGDYASEERSIHEALDLDEAEVEQRKADVYHQVKRTSMANIIWLFIAGSMLAIFGGERVSEFAHTAIGELNLNPIATAVCLAVSAGMSEYVILWRAHRKGDYRIALANAFGGITQVMFLVLPFTLLAIGIYEGVLGTAHDDLPIVFSLSNVLLFVLLFPTFFVLIELIEDDHTLGALDTITMLAIFVLVILVLVGYGGG